MFFILSKLLDVFLSPFSWGLVLLAAAVPWGERGLLRWKRRRALGAAGLAILVAASSSPVANGLNRRLEQAAVSTYREDVVYDAVVLLGGLVDEETTSRTGQPSYNDNVERVIATHRLLRDGRAKAVIVSSGALDAAHAEMGEAAVLGRQLEDWGIAKERIFLEERARNTRENALLSHQIARAQKFDRVLVVTSAYHMVRTRECFAAVSMDVDTLAVDYRAHAGVDRVSDWIPRASALHVTTSMLREMAGRFIYRAQGYGQAAP